MKSSSETAASVMLRLLDRGTRLRAEGGRLRLLTGGLSLDDDLLEAARANKPGLLQLVGLEKIACLSPAQERLWFLAQFGEGDAYNLPGLARVDGPLDLVALRKAFEILVTRHESLRTRFPTISGVPVQAIALETRLPFTVHEVADETAALALGRRLIGQPLDLAKLPLFFVDVARWSPDSCVLLTRMHHIASDGWSLRVLLDELCTVYGRLARGEPADLPLPPFQYAGYASWTRVCQRSTAVELDRLNALRFWEETLAGVQELDLPTDFTRPENLSNRGAIVSRSLEPETNELIRRLVRSRKLTPLSVWLAAVHLVLSRRSRQADFCMGVPVTGRGRPELSPLVGLFVNTLVVRLSGDVRDQTVGKFLEAVHDSLTAAMDRRDVPIEDILARVKPPRRLDRTPLFQVLVNYAADPPSPVSLGDCRLTPLLPESDSAKFEWTFSVTEQIDGGALIAVEYATDLYTPETAGRIAAELSQAVHAMVSDLDQPLGKLDFVPEADLQLLRQWGERPAILSSKVLVHELLERSASDRPDAMAVVDGGTEWSYWSLNEAADQIAIQLLSLGVGARDIVAVCLARSAGFVAAIHGVLKAGAAYLPVGIDEAPRRLEEMLRDSGAATMIVDRNSPDQLRAIATNSGCRLLVLEDALGQSSNVGGRTSRSTDLNRRPDDLAYLMYTSGTTGRPKGVMIEHRSVCNHAAAAIAEFSLEPGDRVAQLSTPAFDIFVEEVFPTLQAGATLVILDDESRRDPRRLAQATRDLRITVLDLPTATFHLIAEDHLTINDLSETLRLVIVGGERLDARLARRFMGHRPGIALVNTYGPTEATMIATSYRVEPGWDGDDVPIGRPIPGAEVLVLDRAGRPAPIAATGELHIGGRGLMRGYLNQTEATDAALVPHPWRPGERLYRTGDLAFWRTDGLLRFVGRSDHQLKIRGYRIEPAEVEAALAEDPSVSRAAVLAVGDPGDRRLIAFVTPSGPETVYGEQVRRRLAGRLPDYMHPAEVRVLASLPIDRGKLDRRSLAALAKETKADSGKQAGLKLDSPTEERVARLWSEILKSEPNGPDANFFDSGGHSLLAVQFVRRLETEFGATIPVAELFRNPTVRGLAGQIQISRRGSITGPAGPRAAVLRQAAATFILPGLPGIGAHYYELAGCLPTDGEILALSLPGYDDDEPATTISEMADLWRATVESLAANRAIRFIAHSYGGNILYEMLRSSQARRWRVESIILLDSMPHERMSRLDGDLLASWTDAFGLDLIPGTRAVVDAALRAPQGRPEVRLDLEVTLVVAEQSRTWLDPLAWNHHFSTVHIVETPGDHLSIVRRLDCPRWIERTFPSHLGGRP